MAERSRRENPQVTAGRFANDLRIRPAETTLRRFRALLIFGIVVGATTMWTPLVQPAQPSTGAALAAASVFISPLGSDTNRCTRARPCATFRRAYRVADPGDIVSVAAGAYRAQGIPEEVSKGTGPRVVFRPPSGALVKVIGGVEVAADHVELRGMTVVKGAARVETEAYDVRFVRMRVPNYVIVGSAGVSVIGGVVGPKVDGDGMQVKPVSPGANQPRNVVVSGVRFKDVVKSPSSDAHVDCIQVMGVDGFVLRNSTFRRCEARGIILTNDFGDVQNVLIENNWFARTLSSAFTVQVTSDCSNTLVRNNSALQAFYPSSCTHARFYSNIVPGAGCGEAEWDYNIFTSGDTCGPHDRNGRSGFRDPAHFDLHLVAGAPAIGRSHPTNYPARDIDGQTRPRGSLPDAGADER
jgi:hypothetical protein